MKKGICITINGYAGAGKSTIAKKIHNIVQEKIGRTVLLDGDNIRKIINNLGFNYGYTKEERTKKVFPEILILKLFLTNNINVIYPTIGLNRKADILLKKEIDNLIQIVIKCSIKKIIKLGKKNKVYVRAKKNIVGLDLKADFPKNPNIVIENKLNGKMEALKKNLIKKLIPIIEKNIN